MSLNLNPWLALILGILIGWVLEWLLELWFFRRQRLACQRRLREVETTLRTREGELAAARTHAASLEADLMARSLVVTRELPEVEVAAPVVTRELPGVAVEAPVIVGELPDVAVEAPVIAVELPTADLVAPTLPAALPVLAIETQEIAAKLPDVALELPEIEIAAPEIEMELPEVALEAPVIEAELPAADLVAPTLAAALPVLAIETQEIAAKLPDVALELPEIEIAAPEIEMELPEVAAKLPDVALELPEVEIAAPEIAAELPEVALELPEVEVAAPEIVAKLPAVALELPEVEIAGPEIAAELPEVALELPEVEIAAPEIAAELPDVAVATPEVKLPQLEAEVTLPGAAALAGIAAGIAGTAAKAQGEASVAEPIITMTALETRTQRTELPNIAVAAISRDNLVLVRGIGPKFASQLYAAGVTSFSALAAMTPDQLQEIVKPPSWQKVDYAAWIAEAKTRTGESHADVSGDELEAIEGIGPVYATKLRAAGIMSFAQLAATEETRLAEIIQAPAWRQVNLGAWREQARAAAPNASVRLETLKDTRAQGCPQDLSRIKGVGAVYEQKLYAAGIGTFSELAEADDEDLKQILDIRGFQKTDLAAIRAGAQRLAEETDTVGRTWDGTPPDDFESLSGLGNVFEGRLYDAGICTYQALAAATVEQLAAICKAPAWRTPAYADWIAQAKETLAQRGR